MTNHLHQTPPRFVDKHKPRADRALLERLVCPVTMGPLRYDEAAQELISDRAALAFPIRDGMPMLVEDEARILED